jgi:hypothetical protein
VNVLKLIFENLTAFFELSLEMPALCSGNSLKGTKIGQMKVGSNVCDMQSNSAYTVQCCLFKYFHVPYTTIM